MVESPASKPDPADALAAMAQGQTDEARAPAGPADGTPAAAEPATQAEDVFALSDEVATPVSQAEALSDGRPVARPASGPINHRARQAAYARLVQASHSRQYKRVMVPVMIVLSMLLLLFGGLSAAIARGIAMFEADSARTPGRFTAYAVVMLTLGVILAGGAWVFHRDAKRP